MKSPSTTDLSIVIVNWNTATLLQECLASLLASSSDPPIEIIVVDNGSTDNSADMVAQNFPQAYLIRNQKNIGFTRANNQGIYASSGRYVLLLNSDTVVTPDVLTRLIQFMENHPDAGAIGPRLSRPSGEPQAFAFGCDPTLSYLFRRGLSHLLLRHPLHDWNTTQIQTVDWVSGACVLVRREAIDRVGLLDENIFMYFEDNDWCLRIRQAGWKVYYNPQVTITHLGGQSLKQNPAAWSAYYHSLDYFYAKHYGSLARWALRVSLLPYRLLVRN